MASESAHAQFPIAVRGYDRAAVDERIAALETGLEQARLRVNELDARASDLARDVSEGHRRAREVERPSYTGLGSRIERMLRLSEEQADDVIDIAATDAQDIIDNAWVEAGQIRANALALSDEIVAAAVREGKGVLSAAELRAGEVTASAEREADELRAGATELIEQARSRVERMTLDLNVELASRREEATHLDAEAHAQAVAQATRLVAEAERRALVTEQRASVAVEQAEAARRSARDESKKLVLAARRNADEVLTEARAQAGRLVEEAKDQADILRRAAQRQVADLTQQRDSIGLHLEELRGLLGANVRAAADTVAGSQPPA